MICTMVTLEPTYQNKASCCSRDRKEDYAMCFLTLIPCNGSFNDDKNHPDLLSTINTFIKISYFSALSF